MKIDRSVAELSQVYTLPPCSVVQSRAAEIVKAARGPDRMTRVEFAARFKAAREATGYTQAEVAAAVGVAQSRIAEYETGVVVPPTLRLVELIELLDLDPTILFPEWFAAKD